LMPLIAPAVPLGDVIVPSARQASFPWAGYDTVVHVAASMAGAMAAVHEAGIVIGDVSESNTAVLADGSVRFWDCDSFQVPKADGGTWRCLVGHSDFTAPEFQGVEFATTDRTASADVFSLAVMLFRILTCGRHPFDAISLDGAVDRSEAIERGWYMCRRDAEDMGLKIPAGMVTGPWDWPLELIELFDRSLIGEPEQRPTASEWAKELRSTRRKMVRCEDSPGHVHFRGTACPWCRLEALNGPQLWPEQAVGEPPEGLAVLGKGWDHPWVSDPRLPEEELASYQWPEAPPLPDRPEVGAAKPKESGTPVWVRAWIVVAIGVVWTLLLYTGDYFSMRTGLVLKLGIWLAPPVILARFMIRRSTSGIDTAVSDLNALHLRIVEYIGGSGHQRYPKEAADARMAINRLSGLVSQARKTLGMTDEAPEHSNEVAESIARLDRDEAHEMAERISEAIDRGETLTPELEQQLWREVREASQPQRMALGSLSQPYLFNAQARQKAEHDYGGEIRSAVTAVTKCLETVRKTCEARRRFLLQSEAAIPRLVQEYAETRAYLDTESEDRIHNSESRVGMQLPPDDLWSLAPVAKSPEPGPEQLDSVDEDEDAHLFRN